MSSISTCRSMSYKNAPRFPQSYGLRMLEAALLKKNAAGETKPGDQKSSSRFNPYDYNPEDPFDVNGFCSVSKHVFSLPSDTKPEQILSQSQTEVVQARPCPGQGDENVSEVDNDSDYVPETDLSTDVSDNDVDIPWQGIIEKETPGTDNGNHVEDPFQSDRQKQPLEADKAPETSNNNHTESPFQNNKQTSLLEADTSKKPKRPCLYCGAFQTQLVRHLIRRHVAEEAVAAALKLPKQDQANAFADIRKLGIYYCNVRRRDEEEPLLRERRQGTGHVLMCSGCKGFFDSRNIWKHKKHCSHPDYQPESVNFSALSVEAKKLDLPEDFTSMVVDSFRKDDAGELCRNDKVILLLGKMLWAKSLKKEKHVIMAEMRLYANIIVEMKKYTLKDDITGESVIDRENFEALNKAICSLTTNESASMKAGLKLRIGYLLKKVIKIMKGYYIMHNNEYRVQEVERFAAVLDLNWDFVFYTAQLTCEQRRNDLRKPQAMPDEEDLKKLKAFMLKEMEALMDPYKKWDKHDFIRMRNLIVSRLTMYNARRGGEPARLTVKEWQEADKDVWVDPKHVLNIDDPLEKALIHSYKLAYQAGKGSRKLVPLLIPNDTIQPMQKLHEERDNFVASENVFLFANTSDSKGHVIGWNCLKSLTKAMGATLKKPDLLIADKFRHRLSTLYALLDVTESERDVFYRHMGHSGDMNRNVYQCPLAIREVTKVGAFLKDVDDGGNIGISGVVSVPHSSDISSAIDVERMADQATRDIPHEKDMNVNTVEPDIPLKEADASIHNDPELTPKDKKQRKYTRWNLEDTEKVRQYFKIQIWKEANSVSKGSLPSKEMIKEFLSKNSIFQNISMSEKEKISLIKIKVFNERKKTRMNKFSSC